MKVFDVMTISAPAVSAVFPGRTASHQPIVTLYLETLDMIQRPRSKQVHVSMTSSEVIVGSGMRHRCGMPVAASLTPPFISKKIKYKLGLSYDGLSIRTILAKADVNMPAQTGRTYTCRG
jgi:hypothetical protein